MTKKLIKDLKTFKKGIKALAKKTESLLKQVDKLEKPKAKPMKAKAVKKAPIKKASAATAADTVLAIIKRYKKGVGNAALIEKTGYNQKKVSNLIYKLRKEGKIKSVDKGVYLKA